MGRPMGFIVLLGIAALLLQGLSSWETSKPNAAQEQIVMGPPVKFSAAAENEPPQPEPKPAPKQENTPPSKPAPQSKLAEAKPEPPVTKSEDKAKVEPTPPAPAPQQQVEETVEEIADAEPQPAPEPLPEPMAVAEKAAEEKNPAGLQPPAPEKAAKERVVKVEKKPQPSKKLAEALKRVIKKKPAVKKEEKLDDFREQLVSDEQFAQLEQAQGKVDERTDAERRNQDENGWYGWGVLNEYAHPDRAAKLLGGVLVAQGNGHLYRLRKGKGRPHVRPLVGVGRVYGAIGVRSHEKESKILLREAISRGALLGKEQEYRLWYLFPRRRADHLQAKTVKAFECEIREKGLHGESAETFRQEARLRGEVLVLRRERGGRLGFLVPSYFQQGTVRHSISPNCRASDDESVRLTALFEGNEERS